MAYRQLRLTLRQLHKEGTAQTTRKYGRLTKKGELSKCDVSTPKGVEGKIVYDSEESANSSAKELLRFGLRPQIVYLCDVSNNNHWHLKTRFENKPKKRKKDNADIS